MVKYFRDRNPFAGDSGDFSVESDCEGDSSDVADGILGVPEGGETALPRAVLTVGSFLAYEYSRPSILSTWLKQQIPQVEISIFLLLHRRDLVRSPQISRSRFSQGLHPQKDGSDGSTTLLPKEYLRLGKSGVSTSDGKFLTTLTHQTITARDSPPQRQGFCGHQK